ncbi:twin-arginine translocase TatA/TatE family subunit [Thermoflavimicrobium dichotomicum]|uniref:Sec-independent protein translocase protein TatA n=1 Tax=Thermoflavimicrobium dichotomicum TaxID=46223 RepID=A0A1I3L696_9BACL|nr:twin-arginine translocase TatA/TatE family subunit [Thermoflavimicrobium dichotomicum]SFI79955.1 sec-independent protein translocase protein TatA [Thermoflavimicrobium dichotomicum]
MFGSIGVFELILILVIVILLFGAKKLPELGKATGQTLRLFRQAVSGKDSEENKEKKKEE